MKSETQNQRPEIEPVNILLVDDKPENLLTIAELLNAPGYNLVKARSGKEALRYLLEMDFALILLDIQMPEMDGFETASWIRRRAKSKHTPIIFVTGVEKGTEDIKKGYSLGAVDYMFKPIIPSFLRTKVSVFVELYRKTAFETKAKERLALMEELERSNRELEAFAYVASHDLQEPLRMVSNYVDLLAKRYKGRLDKDADDFIFYAVEGVERMHRLINDLLMYSRIGRGKPFEPTDLNESVENACLNLKNAIEESGAVITRKNLPEVTADKNQMIQLFQNLIGNAIKFRSDKSQEIHILATRGSDTGGGGPESKPPNPGTDQWLISVRDRGIGFDSRYHERIFQLFQRLHAREKYTGTGIGLAVCKKIVERHKGSIWAESEEGKGATFYFTLPRTKRMKR